MERKGKDMNRRPLFILALVLAVIGIFALGWFYLKGGSGAVPIANRLKPIEVVERVSGEVLTRPMAVAVGQGVVAVADSGNSRVLVLDEKTKALIYNYNENAGMLYPVGVQFDAKNNLWITDLYAGVVKVFDPTGLLLLDIKADTLKTKAFAPAAITMISKGEMAIADGANRLLWIIDGQGQVIKKINTDGAIVNGLLWDEENESLIVADSPKETLHFYSKTGKLIKSVKDGLVHPRGLAWSADQKNFYVVDAHQHRIDLRDRAGRSLGTFGELGSGLNQFKLPMGIATNGRGLIYLADKENNRIVVYQETTN